jgi:chromate transporter
MRANNLKEVLTLFLKLGSISFGGPAAHIAMMDKEIVHKRKWMDRQHFLDLVGTTNLIPGPNSAEMTMLCGYERAGMPGLFLAGICFIFPAVIITGILAWLYVEYGQIPQVEPFVYGIKPAVLAIIAAAIVNLGKKALKNWELGVLGILVLTASMLGINEIAALLIAGIMGAIYFYTRIKISGNFKSVFPFVLIQVLCVSVSNLSTLKVFWSFLKVGAVLYGSGYVLFAYLDTELVAKGLLTRQQLMDAVAVGQFTPGPVLSTATFIGYQLKGFWGAVVATIGVFLPSFLFVIVVIPFIPKMRKSKLFGYFLDSVNIAAVAVMIGVLFEMSRDTLTDWKEIVIAASSIGVTFGFNKISALWIVIGSAFLGYLLYLI